MKTQRLLLFINLYIHFISIKSSYIPQTNIAINCGDPNPAIRNLRSWTSDDGLSNHPRPSSAAMAATQDYAPQIPYMTARISKSEFAYEIPVLTPAHVFIRLHFHSAAYSGHLQKSPVRADEAVFSVTVNRRALFRNFSPSLFADFNKQSYFYKEFIMVIPREEKNVNISFAATKGFYAFVNGIEIVSMPEDLYHGKNQDEIGIVSSSDFKTFSIGKNKAMETMYRLNVNGQSISPENDSHRLFRDWANDDSQIYGTVVGEDPYNMQMKIRYQKVPEYTAPEIMYETGRSMGMNKTLNENYNLTWRFQVDSGFFYLVRLHFCEIAPEITTINQRVFQIFINNQTADDEMDIIAYAGSNGVPIYREFVVMMAPYDGETRDLWLELHPAAESQTEYSDALLNGLEIFKINDKNGDLAGSRFTSKSKPHPSPEQPEGTVQETAKVSSFPVLSSLIVAAAALGGSFIVSLLFCIFYWRRTFSKGGGRRWYPSFGSQFTKTRDLPSDLCRRFSLQEIRSSTDDFSDERIIGAGGFGRVYRGEIHGIFDDEDRKPKLQVVAIKRLNSSSLQGAREFRTEIEMLSRLRHRHLVTLIGYCAENQEMILVYDHMTHGAFRDYLYTTTSGNQNHRFRLPWKQRLEICVGAARGLQYLHTGAKQPIIHRDVKTTNILLGENWVAKVSDFGLSRVGPSNVSKSHISTQVKGSFGYLDPEYYRRQQLTDKSDVYSFGVVLYEVLCGRPPLDKELQKEEMCLSEWARAHHAIGLVDRIVDPSLTHQIMPRCLKTFSDVASKCLKDHGIERPSMSDVVGGLELALRLQESGENTEEMNGGDCVMDKENHVLIDGGDVMRDLKLRGSESGFSSPVICEDEPVNDVLV